MNIRKLVYIVKDQLKKGSLNENLADLTSQFNHVFPAQSSRLQAITQYAIENTPHYNNYKEYDSFNEYPVLDKSIIKRNYNDFISNPYKEEIGSLHKVTTSGSYGTPFTFYLNSEKRKKMIAEVYYFGKKSNFVLGSKHAYIVSKKKSKTSQLIQNQVMITVDKLDDEWCKASIARLKKQKVKVLVGYPSAITRLASYIYRNDIHLPMNGIITISEVLSDAMRLQIENSFECPPVSRYSSEEFGVLANQDLSGEFFWLNQANYLVEILELNSNKEVAIGELGRIVVTDLFNEAMPLIRYDTGDLAKPYEIIKGQVTKIESVEGRKLATIRDVKGEEVSSFSINGALRESIDIIQFQFSQEGSKEYLLKIITDKSSVGEVNIIQAYRNILGSGAIIKFNYVDDIPAQRSGKRPYIIQNFYVD
ncbi:hypothetical protein ACT3QR_11825 [Psychrobacter sp. AOP7-B1-25]|uniref:hypothetical protein n=1 Tax=Psychrobacter sp. AOP7-B1-25 TaxID=3457644 RepID=UPI00402B2D4F